MAEKPPESLGRGGRGALLLAALKNQPRRPGQDNPESSSTDQPVEQKSLGRGAFLKTLAQSRGRAIPSLEEPEPPKIIVGGRGRGLSAILSGAGRAVPKTVSPPPPVEAVTALPSSLSSQVEELHISRPETSSSELPIVKYTGTSGTELKLEVNYVHLKNVGNEGGIFEYHVSFVPSVDSKNMKFRLMKQESVKKVIALDRPVFDGSKLYLPRKLAPLTEIHTNLPTDGSAVTVNLKYIKMCQPNDCLHLYNLLFKRAMIELKMTQIGRNYFDPKGSMPVPQHTLEVWPGYVTAVQDYEGGVMLNCDSSFKVLRTITARDVMQEASRQGRNVKESVAKALIGTVIITRYNNKTYRIDDIAWDMNPASKFTTKKGTEISFCEYYKNCHDLKIQDINQPLLINKPKKKEVIEPVQDKLICLVPELCYMTGLTDEMRSDFKVMKDIAVHTRVTPERRQLALQKFIQNINNTPKVREIFRDWNLEVDASPMCVSGRLLKTETLHFGNNRKIEVGPNADWGREATSNKVLVSVNFEKWVIVFVKKDAPRAMEFTKMLHNVCPPMGILVKDPIRIEIHSDRTETYCEALKGAINPTVQIVVIIFPTARDDRYSAVKKLCCVDMPVASQVINSKTISNPAKLRSIVQKIALQMNCKLGGELWTVTIPIDNLMICGLDTYHDASRSKKSVLAFVASMNYNRTRWFSMASMQKAGQEAGDCLKMLFISALRKYFEVNHQLPEKVVLFRDGVGDGQMDFIAKYEVEQLTSCYKHFAPDYSPSLSVVVVQKRINTRMYAVQNERGRKVLSNPPPGSIIDHSITRKRWYDYFLVSQHVRQGTVSPTHYVVIYDTSTLKPEHMQRMTYKMTHLYYNWPGTVRVPAPCQYAHKLAYLVGQNIHRETHCDLSDRLFYL